MKNPGVVCLGTVKLGVPDYGFLSGYNSRTINPENFLKQAQALGICRFDTSPRYGNSEEIIGQYILNSKQTPLVSTKIDNLQVNDSNTPRKMAESVKLSLEKLRLKIIDICYLHQNNLEVISDPYVREGLVLLKKQGFINYSGASLYTEEECGYALESGIFDVIQVPVSIFNLDFYNRFIRDNRLPVRFAARSLLLQGILINRAGIKSRIQKSTEVLEYLGSLDGLADKYGLSVLEMALAFVFSLEGIDHYLIGTTSLENLQKDLSCLKIKLPGELFAQLFEMASRSKDWTDPRSFNQ
jgi:aryl-alcohol dehydrogenase-like predicted oxidoreductase